jgi:cytoskeletal protein RodZ
MVDGAQHGLAANPVGDRLRAAREEKGLSLDDVASQTRVPTRHLQHIDNGDWEALPAPTYSVGFARAYANAVGLNGTEVAAELRAQLGSGRNSAAAAVFNEPADPARVPPRSLALIAAILAILIAAGYAIWRSNAVDDTDPLTEAAAVDTPIVAPPPAAAPPAGAPGNAAAGATTGPVVLTATSDVWLRVYEGNRGPKLFENTLKAGERFEVPATAQQPQILTGRPDAIQVTVGQTAIPQLGPAQRTISDVSLLPADLLARAQGPAPAAPVAPAPRPQ